MTLKAQLQALAPEILASQDEAAIAAALNAGRTKIVTKLGGIGTVLEALGPTDGAVLLDSLESQAAFIPALKWAFVLINRGELDFGSPATRAMIDALLPAPVAAALKAVAEVPDPVDITELRAALWSDDGAYKWL